MEHYKDYEKIKMEIASELGINLNPSYNGNLTTKEAGKLGGIIGGNMVRTMIQIAEENLANNNKNFSL